MRPGRLLDVGCGRGDLGAWMIARGWSVTGVEPSPGACEVARSRGLDARVGVLAEAGIEDGAYDAVVFRQSLEHLPEPAADIAPRTRRAAAGRRPGRQRPELRQLAAPALRRCLVPPRPPPPPFPLRRRLAAGVLARGGFVDVETSTSTTPVGLPASIQYALAGRCLFPGGLALRAAVAACALLMPLTWAANRLAGEGDVLHALARRP